MKHVSRPAVWAEGSAVSVSMCLPCVCLFSVCFATELSAASLDVSGALCKFPLLGNVSGDKRSADASKAAVLSCAVPVLRPNNCLSR